MISSYERMLDSESLDTFDPPEWPIVTDAPWIMRDLALPIEPESTLLLASWFGRLGIGLIRIQGGKVPTPEQLKNAGSLKNWAKEPTGDFTDPQRAVSPRKLPKKPRPTTAFAGIAAEWTGWVLVDVDSDHPDVLDAGPWGTLPKGWLRQQVAHGLAVRTGSGGYHLWFRWPKDLPWPGGTVVDLGEFGRMELKATGTGTLAPGFRVHEGTEYRYELLGWCHEWRNPTTLVAPPELVAMFPKSRYEWLRRIPGVILPEDMFSQVSTEELPTGVAPLDEQSASNTQLSSCVILSHSPLNRDDANISTSVDAITPTGDQWRASDDRITAEVNKIVGIFRERRARSSRSVDSDRDGAIARAVYRLGGDIERFAFEIGRLDREKSRKRFDRSYIEKTWERCTTHGRPLTDIEVDELRRALADPHMKPIKNAERKCLDWLVAEAIRHRSYVISPGYAKIASGCEIISLSWVPDQLDRLVFDGVITVTEREAKEREVQAHAISVRPLVRPLAFEEHRDQAIRAAVRADTRKKPPTRPRTERQRNKWR